MPHACIDRRHPAPHARALRPRRGAALAIALLFILAMGAIATTAVVLGSDSTLLAHSANHDADLRYAAEAALNFGKSRLNASPASLPDTGVTTLLSNAAVFGADGQPVNGVHVNVWLGQTGSTTGQFGHFASVVAQAVDARGTGYVGRLELQQESFAKFAYWTNHESNNGQVIWFAHGDQIWGPVFSNDVLHIDASGATFNDVVSTAQTISGAAYGTFRKGYRLNQKPIALPTNAALAKLQGYATSGNMAFNAPTNGNETTVRMRIEFSPADLDGDGDSTGVNEGFFRVYQAGPANSSWLRGDWPGAGASVSSVVNCGDWHSVVPGGPPEFFPASVHATSWFRQLMLAGGMTASAAAAESSATLATIMTHANARCYLGGDPHLVAVERTASAYPNPADRQKGGDDTTFTPIDPWGAWVSYPGTPDPTVSQHRADAAYLFPLYRGLNPGSKGVIYVQGTVGVSGVLRGRVTLYANAGTVVVLDNTRYTADPSKGNCLDMLGVIADNDIVVADNALLTPQQVRTSPAVVRSLNSTNYLSLQAVLMALHTSFRVEDYSTGPTSGNNCQGVASGRGCLYLTGGIIQDSRGPVGTSIGTGYIKRYAYDRCAALRPPPYFPTTGRFNDNRWFAVNPIGFDAHALFTSLKPGP